MSKKDWFAILLLIDIIILVSANELGYGIFALGPCLLLGNWLMRKVFEEEHP
jgi:hypothetical protein